jgi:mannose-6-phosphate isomerase-like protein (cupin superfamily)
MLKLINDFTFDGITEASLKLDDVLASPFFYEQGLVKYVLLGQSHDAYNPWDYIQNSASVFKIEGFERFSLKMFDECRYLAEHYKHHGAITCHVFKSPKGAKSFPEHTDPDDVVLYMVSGQKEFVHDGGVLTLHEGEILLIPAGTRHRAVNTEASVMLSFGLERFLVEKL